MLRPDLAARHAQRRGELRAAARLRELHAVDAVSGVRLRRAGAELVGYCSNDYLGLAQHPALRQAAQRCIEATGVGSGSAHLICGHHREHAALEAEFAEWQQQPRALLFGSGYLANLGVLQGLLAAGDLCVQDKLNHACLLDGARLSGATLRRYPHADVAAAARQLATAPNAAAMLASDGVFSMDGDLAPLLELSALATREGATLYVDDAHGGGVLGPQGRGSAAHCGLHGTAAPLQLFTLGKAFGSYGGMVVGNEALIDALLQSARSYLFATAMPAALAAASRAALAIVRSEQGDVLRECLHRRIARFRAGATELGLPLLPSASAIQPLLLGSDAAAVAAAHALQQQGLLVVAIRPPTVAEGQARLRITLSALHSDADIDRLLDALPAACQAARAAAPGTIATASSAHVD